VQQPEGVPVVGRRAKDSDIEERQQIGFGF
jgi:hypothetical protein